MLSALYWLPDSIDLRPLVAAHITAQCVFTVGAHLREMREPSRGPSGARHLIASLFITSKSKRSSSP